MAGEASLFTAEEYQKEFKKNKKGKKEEGVQVQVCAYLKLRYPGVIFTCDLASGMKLPVWIGLLHSKMRSSRGLPDMFIAHPSYNNGFQEKLPGLANLYYGLFIELKKDGVTVKLKNGNLPANEHIQEQAAILKRLRVLGYRAEFCCGYTEAINLIDEYLK